MNQTLNFFRLKNIYLTFFAIGIGAVLFGIAGWSYRTEPRKSAVLLPNNAEIVKLGRVVYSKNCASCHGPKLEGQTNWRERGPDGKLPAPPHDQTGHTWHHSDEYLFQLTKYGIAKMIGQKYPNNMPAYAELLNDREIIAVLSFIKSTWPQETQRRHDRINNKVRDTQ